MKKKKQINDIWLEQPEQHDYPAAKDYLELLFSKETAEKLTQELEDAEVVTKKAKDIKRASGLTLLGPDNVHVCANLKKLRKGKKLSPLLLVVDSTRRNLIIADGFHRESAVEIYAEDTDVKCKIAYK